MIITQTNTAYFSSSRYDSFQGTGTLQGNQGITNQSRATGFFQFRSKVSINTKQTTIDQGSVFNLPALNRADLTGIEYNGRPVSELSQGQAAMLVEDEGYFGVKKTAERIARFVINGAGDDLERLKAGREGVLQGFKEAEGMWGGHLPSISYQTLEKALEMIDGKINESGGNVTDIIA